MKKTVRETIYTRGRFARSLMTFYDCRSGDDSRLFLFMSAWTVADEENRAALERACWMDTDVLDNIAYLATEREVGKLFSYIASWAGTWLPSRSSLRREFEFIRRLNEPVENPHNIPIRGDEDG